MRVWVCVNSVKTEFCVQEKKSTKKCVQKESKSNNVQRATFSLSGAAENKQKFKTLAAVESYSYSCILLAPCEAVGSRLSVF